MSAIMNNAPATVSNIIDALKGGTCMFQIKKLNIGMKIITTIPYPRTVALEWAEAKGRAEDAFLIVDHSFDKKKNVNAQKNLDYVLNNGVTIGGIHYVWVMAGSSQLRKGNSTFIDETLKDEFLKYILCGVDDRKNLVANKTLVYRALSMSSTYRWEDKYPENAFFGLVKAPDINKVGIFKDIETKFTGIFDVVEEMQTLFGEQRTVSYKITDGIAYYVVNDMLLNSKQRYELVKSLDDATFRAPGFKGLFHFILKSTLCNWISFNKMNPVIKDLWGNKLDIRNLQVITFGSVFKWSKCVDAEGWETYKSEFKRIGHEFRICVTAHDRMGDIPYQQMQTLQLERSDAELLGKAAIRKMSKYSDPEEASRLIGGAIGEAVSLYPELLTNRFVYTTANNSYISKRGSIAGGRVPEISRNLFAAPDTIAVFEGLCGVEPNGVVEANTVICNQYEEGTEVDVTRCPHLDNAHCVRTVKNAEDTKLGFFLGTTIFFSCHEATMSTLQMDFDGDHVNVTDNKFIVKKAKESIERLGNRPLYYEAKGSKASYATDEDILKLLSCIEPAPVGLYANTLTKIYANGINSKKDLDNVATCTEAANTCIDAAKYISGDSVEAAGFRGVKLIDKFNGIKLPMYNAYAKSSPFVVGSLEARMEKSKFYPECGLDIYCKYFLDNTSDHLVVTGIDQMQFNYKVLGGDPHAVRGLVNIVTNKQQEGIFRTASKIFEDEFEAMNKSLSNEDEYTRADSLEQFSTAKAEEIRNMIIEYGNSVGSDLENTVNYLVEYLFTVKMCPDSMMRLLWACFGKEIVANIKKNLNK